ncbi:glycine zipper 2TM domain-containing protein [Massilia sp.]|uniref:glycine zipper 2TM domain-containing protein n=1 Tax=Massilia sp. TaxID=1882437 RepID=UPI00352FC49B
MDTHPTPPARAKQHPLLIAAAIAVILFCAIGTAAIMGWLPSSTGHNRGQLSDADRAALSAGLQQPGQPGYVAPATVPAAPLASQPQTAYPVQTPVQSAYPAPAGAQSYAAPDTAYGDGGSRGSTSAGADYAPAPAPAPQYAPVERAPAPKVTHQSTKLASNDTGSNWCNNCGNIESIRQIKTRAQGSGVGAAGGAILGGLLGNQVGSGHGRQLATVAGAVGGAVVGNQVEGNMKADVSYEIRVRLDDGTLRTFHQHSAPPWRTGDRVRIVKGSLRSA